MIFSVRIDSIVDTITNSSSELFVVSEKLSIEAVTNLIENLFEIYKTTSKNKTDVLWDGILKRPYVAIGYCNDENEYCYKDGDIIFQSYDDYSIPYGFMKMLEGIGTRYTI